MATTTNFGWTTPDDTDLVKNGASAIRTLGSAIDTSALSFKGQILISTTTLSGSTVTLSSIPQTYRDLKLVVRNFLPSVDGGQLRLRFNADSTANRHKNQQYSTALAAASYDSTSVPISNLNDNAVAQGLVVIDIPDYANAVTRKMGTVIGQGADATTTTNVYDARYQIMYSQTSAITSLELLVTSGTMGGTVLLYGFGVI